MEATSQPRFSQNYHTTQESVTRSSQNYHSSLHSTRKQPVKPWKTPVTSSLQRMRPTVYRVEPVNFKELVQRLTGGTKDHEPEVHQGLLEAKPLKSSDDDTANENPFAFDLSPSSSQFWEAFPLLSHANLSRW